MTITLISKVKLEDWTGFPLKTDLRHTDTLTLISNLSIFQSVSKLFSLVELDL